MLIRCLHGYFIFRESSPGQISRFLSIYKGLDIVPHNDFYTFSTLATAPTYSIEGSNYLGAEAVVTYQGPPWAVMEQNELVYDFNRDLVVPIESVTQRVDLKTGFGYYLSPGLILPGSVMDDGSRVTDYAAWYLFDTQRFKYSGVSVA